MEYRIFNVAIGLNFNQDAYTEMNQALYDKIINNQDIYKNVNLKNISKDLDGGERTESMKYFFQSKNIEKYNIGDLSVWDNGYIIVGTPFARLDIIDYQTGETAGHIDNSEYANNNNNEEKNFEDDIIIYNMSNRINDPEFCHER